MRHLPLNNWVELMRQSANGLAIRYGGPVFLVGGALREDQPHDYDVRIPLTEWRMQALFGRPLDPEKQWSWMDYAEWEWLRGYYSLKVSSEMSYAMQSNVDVQFQTQREWKAYRNYARLRLDSAPREFFAAGERV